MMSHPKSARWLLAALALGLVAAATAEEVRQTSRETLRVCADPNNLPYSNRKLEGFENEIALLVADELGRSVAYTWWPQRRGFLRRTLKADKCDVVIGVPASLDPVLTTEPYYRSSYVFLFPEAAGHRVESLEDPALRHLRIGVHLIGDDYANSPPAHALGARGIVDNVVGYSVYGDYGTESPSRALVDAVGQGDLDVAIVWGPIGGYFGRDQPAPMTLLPVPVGSSNFRFSYEMAMGVRHGEGQLRDELNGVLKRRASEIQQILRRYAIPIDAGEKEQ